MQKITFLDRLHYRFDLTMAKGAPALIAWLFALSTAMVVVFAAIVVALGLAPAEEDGAPVSFPSALWITLMRALDAGTVAGDTGSRGYLAVMFAVTLGGIFMVSILIGIITSGIEDRVGELRKGRSLVCEEGHTVILGWSPQIFSMIQELAIANESRPRAAIAVLADKDKVEMEDEIRARVGSTGRTRVVCRTGDPTDPADIAIVNPDAARSIIILSPEEGNPDSRVIKSILALTNKAGRKKGRYPIVTQIRDQRNLDAARLVARDEAALIPTEDVLTRITVQTCRSEGLSVVYSELLDFEGHEIYTREEPALAGRTFGEALFAYDGCAVIGLRLRSGEVRLNPPMNARIEPGDAVILIAEDDSAIGAPSKRAPSIDERAIRDGKPAAPRPERTLLLGWNRRAVAFINELDHYVAEGSEVTVVADVPDAPAQLEAERGELRNLTVTFQPGDTTDRRTLDRVVGAHDHVVTLSYSDALEPQEADARTLVTLLHLRDIEAKRGQRFSIVSEMLDVRNRELAEVAHADDFIVSDKLVSLMLAQISENRDLAAVFTDLFDPEGSELYLKPAGDYVRLARPVTFATIVEAARRRGEVAVGVRLASQADDASQAYGVKVNPRKRAKLTLARGDRIIVLAEQ
ncbi:CASTOR/POLLUX-related putative ion channel [Sorangium sp. So ce1335]|uniref:CASTOR/POLLUX-related putative ion channel n=1 Tax=Sorangium sp. So ce1335 TaxID=3133335 RepID=UPI003F5F2981